MNPDPQAIGRFYLRRSSEGAVTLNIPGTGYEIDLRPTAPAIPSPQGRVRGVIRLPVWKLDLITAGGAFIEPIYGRPRRVQGNVIGRLSGNRLIVDVYGQPIVGDLPDRWNAAELPIGSRVGLDVMEGGVFEPLPPAANREPDAKGLTPVNLGIG